MPTDVPKVTEKTSGPTVKQFSIFLQNKVGALLEVVKLLNANEVHVLALNSQDSTDSAIVRIIASDPDAVESLFDLHEIAYSISEILVVEMKEVATDLKRMLQRLADGRGQHPGLLSDPHSSSRSLCDGASPG